MTDLYGDGWDGAMLFVEFPDGSTGSDAPTSTQTTIVHDVCSEGDGNFYVTVATEDKSTPTNYWEIVWSVEVCTGNTTTTYHGGWNTTMIFSVDSSVGEWNLVYVENVFPPPSEEICNACGDASQCDADDYNNHDDHEHDDHNHDDHDKPRRRRRSRRGRHPRKRDDDRKGSRPRPQNPGHDDNGSSNITRRMSAGDDMSYPRPADTRVTMYDQEGDGWFTSDGLGPRWFLSDVPRTTLLHEGTLCTNYTGYCNMCVAENVYSIRFTGNAENFTAWDFCGVTGPRSRELIFEVEDGQCIPIALLVLDHPKENVTEIFESSLELCLNSEILNITDPAAVAAITQTLIDVLGAESASIFAVEEEEEGSEGNGTHSGHSHSHHPTPTRASKKDDDRKGKRSHSGGKGGGADDEVVIYNHKFQFHATFYFPLLEIKTRAVMEEELAALLAGSIANGTFISTLKANAVASGYLPLNWTSCAISDEFESISIEVTESLPFAASPILFAPSSTGHHETVVASYDYSSLTLFFGALLVGFVAFVGILARGMNGYDTLNDHSEHLDDSYSSSGHSQRGLINGIEMDHTISNPLGRNAAHDADMTRVSNAL